MAETLLSPGVLARENDNSFIAPAPLEAGAAILGPTVKGPVEEPILVTSYGEYQNVFGTTFTSGSTKQEFLTSLAVKSYFNNGGNTVLVTRIVTGSFTAADNTDVAAADAGAVPFTLQSLGKGSIFNNATGSGDTGLENSDGSLQSGSQDNFRYEVTNVNNSTGTFSLLIRRGDDNSKNKIVLETWNDLSLDPESPNYIESVIGNQSKTLDTAESTYYIKTTGEYTNKSRFVRVASVGRQTLTYLANDGLTVKNDGSGNSYSGSLPTAQSGSFYNANGSNVIGTAGRDNYFIRSVSIIE